MHLQMPAIYRFPEHIKPSWGFYALPELLDAVNARTDTQERSGYNLESLLRLFIHLSKAGKPYNQSCKASGYSTMLVIIHSNEHCSTQIIIRSDYLESISSDISYVEDCPLTEWYVPAGWGMSVLKAIDRGVERVALERGTSGLGWRVGNVFYEIGFNIYGIRIVNFSK